MVDKQVRVRLVMDGGRVVESQLEGIGTKGKAAFTDLDRASGQMRGNLQNVGYQLQDFFVQVSSGTDASRALGQQLPQLLSSFGLMGVLAGTAAAMVVPLASAFLGLADDADNAEESLKSLGAAMSAVKDATAAASADKSDLFSEYGMGADQAKQALEIERQMAQLRAERALAQASMSLGSGAVGEGSRDMGQQLADARQEYALLTAEIEAFDTIRSDADQRAWDALQARRAALDEVYRSTLNYRNAMNDFADELGLMFEGNEVALQNINNAMLDLASAATIEDQAAAAAALRAALFEASDGGRLLSEEGQKLLDGLTDAELAALALAKVDIASGIDAAGAAAMNVANNLGIAYSQAVAIMSLYARVGSGDDERGSQRETVRGANTRMPEQPWLKDYTRGGWISTDSKGGSRGGGGGGQKAENDLMREAQKLYEQTRTDAEKYTEEVARLDEMLKAGVIDQDLYNRGLERAAEKFGEASGAAAFFKEMNIDIKETLIDVAMEGGDALDGLIEKLKRAAFEAMLFGTGPIADLFGLSGGGIFGDGFTGIFAGGKATGGDVVRGKAYRVGETGPEVFVPATDGTIFPVDPMSGGKIESGMAAGRGIGGGGTSRLMVELGEGLIGRILSKAADQTVEIVERAITANNRHAVPSLARGAAKNPRRV